MRRHVRPGDAELGRVDPAHRRRRPERDLDGALEIRLDVDQARLAVDRSRQVPERRLHGSGAAAERTEELPAQLEQAVARRLQAELERYPALDTPVIREQVWPKPGHAEIVSLPDERAEPVDDLRCRARVDQSLPGRRYSLPCSGRDPRRRDRERLLIARPPVVGAEDGGEASAAAEADLDRDRDSAEQVARPGTHLV